MSEKSTIVNVGSVIIGVLVFLTASAWIRFFRDLTDEVYLNEEYDGRDRFERSWRSLLIAIINVIILCIAVIIIYCWYHRAQTTMNCITEEGEKSKIKVDGINQSEKKATTVK